MMTGACATSQSGVKPLHSHANQNAYISRCINSPFKAHVENNKRKTSYFVRTAPRYTIATASAASSDAQSAIAQEPTTTGRKIVFAVDGTADAEEGLRWLVKNICRKGDTVHLAHVLCDSRTPATAVGSSTAATQWSPARDEQVYAREFFNRLEHEAQTMMANRFIPSLQFTGINHEVELLRLRVHRSAAGIGEALANCASSVKADLLVVASHGAGVLADYGSVARWVSENSPIPALLLPPAVLQQGAPGVPANTIMVAAADDLNGLKHAFSFAADSLSKPGDNIYVIHAANIEEGDEEAAMKARKELIKSAVQWQEESTAPHNKTLNVAVDIVTAKASEDSSTDQDDVLASISIQSPVDSPAGKELCQLANDLNAKAVIFHHHGRNIMREMMYSPVTLCCLKHCERPLIVWENPAMVRYSIDMD